MLDFEVVQKENALFMKQKKVLPGLKDSELA